MPELIHPRDDGNDTGDDESDDEDDDSDEESRRNRGQGRVLHPNRMSPSVQLLHGINPNRRSSPRNHRCPRTQPRTPKHKTRGNKRDYGFRYGFSEDNTDAHAHIMYMAMTQYSLKKGLKKFGKRAEDAITKEFLQLHLMGTFQPIYASDLSDEEKAAALESLMFLKEKRDGKIKGRTCADGRKQRETSEKQDVTSPTVALESVMLTSTVDAYEERDVAVADIPGAFLTADMDELVRMCLRGRLAELMVKAAPEIYSKYVTIENGVTVLYVTLQKALYGTLKAALLFYTRLVKDLKDSGSRSTHTTRAWQTRWSMGGR